MEKQISLTFGNIIAHLVPGILGLLIVTSDRSCTPFANWISDNVVVLTSVFLSLSLAFGLVLDSIRYLVIRLACLIPTIKKRHCFEFFPKKEQIEEFNWIIENYYRHHQFCGNLALVSALLFLIPDRFPLFFSIPLTLLLTAAALLMYQRTVDALNKAIPAQKIQ
jgi:hypothetical protein